ncbi:MAG: glycosyltransferase family 4 protein [Bergeyella sp.]|nr:glycosyltransferase family 4 protein [Bergeyella sp.]
MNELKKILIITYYWPPAGGPGVQRWVKFAKYLPEFGWKPVIYTPENPNYPLTDNSLKKDFPTPIEIIKTKIWEPYRIAEKLNPKNKKFKAGQFDIGSEQNWRSKLSLWIRGNFFIPDARIFWVKPSVHYLSQYLKKNPVKAVITTGPPHSLHLIGLELKRKNPHLKWLADFRDPWTDISYYKHLKLSSRSDKKHKQLESEVLKNADITLATSFTDCENYKAKGARAFCITNGFDHPVYSSSLSTTDKFTLSYIGILEQLRNPKILWHTLETLLRHYDDFREEFRLKWVGKIDDAIQRDIEKYHLSRVTESLGYLSHEDSLKEMQNSDLLIITNFSQPSSRGIIPGKLFEYMASGKKILSYGPKGADVEKILEASGAGKHFDDTQGDAMKEYIISQYLQWKQHIPPSPTKNIEIYSRKNLTQKLSELLSTLPEN